VQSVERALAALQRVEPHRADDARLAWDALVGAAGPQTLTQWRLQQFCWEELPQTRLPGGGSRQHVVEALAALLQAVGFDRYAAIANGEVTREVLALSEHTPERGRALARRAAQRSGIEPPSTELLTWGSTMGPAEAFAQESVATTLELAVAAGELVPGARGWRDRQADLTVTVLRAPRASLDGGCAYDRVLRERLARWIRGTRSTTRSAVLSPLEPRLAEPVTSGTSEAATVMLRPLVWLLTEVADGLILTAAGYLPPRTVGRALDVLGWREELIGASNREVDAYPVLVLRETAARLGLIRRRGSRLLPTPTGRAAAGDVQVLWSAVASRLIGFEHSAQAVAWEVVLAVLEAGDTVVEEDVRELVQAVITESGWRVAGRREPAEADTSPLFFAVLRELRWLELVEESGALLGRRLQARPGASELFRAALRYRVLHRDVAVE
jgi:hypothetical protein